MSSSSSSPMCSICRSIRRKSVALFIFIVLLLFTPYGATVDTLTEATRHAANGLDVLYHHDRHHQVQAEEESSTRRRNLRSNKHKHHHAHKHSHSAKSHSSSPDVTKVADNSEAKAAYAAEKLRISSIESKRTDKKPLSQLYTEEVVLLFEALHVYNCAPIIRYNHLEGANLMEIDNAIELQKVGIQIPTSDANSVYQEISKMRTGGVPVLYIEQKPPKLFAEIELKERGSKKDEGGSYRCPTFEAPKVEYASEVPSTSSSGNTNTAGAASAGGNGGGGDETGNTSIQPQPPQAAVTTRMSPFTPVLPPEVAAGGTTPSVNININNNNNNNNNDNNNDNNNNNNDKNNNNNGMNTGSNSISTGTGESNNNGGDKVENKNDNQNQGGDSSNSKFAGNFKKTSTGKIVVKDASGNEIHF